ncbi:MAG: hypothetical protein DRI61_12355, partial [Chloroflexi bacterium]
MRRFDHRKALITIWGILIVWAIALGVWWQKIERSPAGIQSRLTLAPAATPTATVTAEVTPYVVATPVTEPVTRQPDEVAQDYIALAFSFDEEEAFEIVEELASSRYSGRRAGSPEGRAAADYLVRFFQEYGLQPAGPGGSYFQEFPVPYVTLKSPPRLSITSADGTVYEGYKPWHDFAPVIRYYAGAGEAEGPIIWVNRCSYDDFNYVDAVGKVVLCRASPHAEPLRNAVEHGAAGLLLIARPSSFIDRIGPFKRSYIPSPIPTFIITNTVLSDILAGTGITPADLSLTFKPRELPTRAHLKVEVSYDEAIGRNILGVIPGRSPAHRDEVLILGAHYDHMGSSPEGTFWAGANDNASGVAVLLEIARQWKEHGYVPRRTVLFALWDGEEQGRVGSEYYVKHPSYPITSTVAMIQLDMVGKKGGDALLVDGAGDFARRMETLAKSLGYNTVMQETGGSDHASFRAAGVPAVLFIWWDMKSPLNTYHRPVDLPDTIEPETLAQTGHLTHLALLSLAEAEPAIEDLIARQQAALSQGDEAAFLATASPEARESIRGWFHRWQSLGVESPTISLDGILFSTDVATATLRLRARQGDKEVAFTLRTRWVLEGGHWLYAGPAVQEFTGGEWAKGGGQATSPRLQSPVEAAYRRIAGMLNLEPKPFTLYVSPEPDELRAWVLDPAFKAPVWVGDGEAFIQTKLPLTATSILTPTLVQVLLSHYDVRGRAPWLWDGLPLYLQELKGQEQVAGSKLQGAEYALRITQHLSLSTLRKVLSQSTSPEPGTDEWLTRAWAMTAYLGLDG